jgi:AGCS family alanine or glycine:cation symporter
MFSVLVDITDFLWGTPMFIIVILVGLFLSIRTGFFQITGFGATCKKTFGELFNKDVQNQSEGTLTAFQALSTVLAGTVGSGNIAGVAAAIAIGGPGAVFWMWVCATFGMLTKMAEVSLAVKYRVKDSDGEFYGGPMYYIKNGLGGKWNVLAVIYSIGLFILVVTDACFVQVNTMATAAQDAYGIPLIVTGLLVIVVSLVVVIGGTKRIGEFCGRLVPPMCIVWILGCLIVIIANIGNIGSAFGMIFKYAFAPLPAIGGFAGSTISLAMARGASRGIFSNEAGEGTAATVHATAKTDHPIHQGMYGIIEVFIDTIIICTLTALAILCAGDVWSSGDTGVVLTFAAFRATLGNVGVWIVGLAVVLFCFSSYLGFFVEFRTSCEHLFGSKIARYVKWLFFVPPIFSVTMAIETVWSLADMAVGLVFLPNVIALIALSPKFFEMFKEYKAKLAAEKK